MGVASQDATHRATEHSPNMVVANGLVVQAGGRSHRSARAAPKQVFFHANWRSGFPSLSQFWDDAFLSGFQRDRQLTDTQVQEHTPHAP